MTSPDPCLCPLCSLPNECGVAAGKGICWCFSRPIADHVLEGIPPAARDAACICRSCAFGERDAARARELIRLLGRGR